MFICVCFLLLALCCICLNLIFRILFFYTLFSWCRSLCHFFRVASLVLFFLRCSSSVAPHVVPLLLLLALFLSRYLFSRYCSLHIIVPLVMLFFECWCSFRVVTPPALLLLVCHSSHVVALMLFFLHYTFHTSLPTLHLLHCSSRVTTPTLLVSRYSSHVAPCALPFSK
jgi:hypothetical protein